MKKNFLNFEDFPSLNLFRRIKEKKKRKYFLEILGDKESVKKKLNLELKESIVFFGRSKECLIQFPKNPEISRKHCEIFEDNVVYIRHLSSSRIETFLNGEPLNQSEKRVLINGDIIEISSKRFRFSISPSERKPLKILVERNETPKKFLNQDNSFMLSVEKPYGGYKKFGEKEKKLNFGSNLDLDNFSSPKISRKCTQTFDKALVYNIVEKRKREDKKDEVEETKRKKRKIFESICKEESL